MCNPSEILDKYWLSSKREVGQYPEHTQRSGKWMIFKNISEIDETWEIIKNATIEGKLGKYSKVSTAKPNSNAKNKDMKVIIIYTYDYSDKKDVFDIRHKLYNMGFTEKLVYKTDQKTIEGKYSWKGYSVGTYYK